MSKHTRSGEIRDFNKRDRSDSLDRVFNAAGSQNSPSGLNPLWEDAPDALASSIEQMHLLNQKKLRDGPGPNSYKQNDGDIFDAYFTGNEGSGTLDSDGMAGSLGFDDGLQFGSHSDIDGSFGGRGKAGLDGGFFAMDDLGGSEQALSNSFKESMTFAKTEPEDSMPSFMSPPSQATETVPTRTSNKKKPAANSAAGALSASTGASEKISPAKSTGGNKAASAAAMLGGHPPSSAAMAAAMPPASAALATPSIAEEGTERLSHKEVEQRRREKAKQYFDELRALLPCGADSKFDKNTILQNTIAMIKQLQAELENYREIKMGGKRPPTQPASHDFKNSFDVTRQPLCFCGLDGCSHLPDH